MQAKQSTTCTLPHTSMATYNILVHLPGVDVNKLRPISLNIASTDTVGMLADLVKTMEPTTLSALNLSALELYKVNAFDNKTAIEECQPTNMLVSRQQLDEVLPSPPPKGTIHIVVKVPRKSVGPRVHDDSSKT